MYLFICLIPFILLPLLGIYVGYRLLHPHRVSPEEAFQSQLQKGEISEEFLKKEKINFSIPSDFGYSITGFYFPGTADKVVIFSHGISWNKLGSAKYLDQFFKGNYTIVLYDHRGAGESGGKYPSFGFFEKFDLKKVKEFIKSRYPNTKVWGLFGESMGGATVLQYTELDSEIHFIVSVCSFSSLNDLMKYHLKKNFIPKLLYKFILFFTELYLGKVGGFHSSQINPLETICKTKIPLFLSHGTDDKLVPYEMGKLLMESREKIGPTFFLEGKGSGHTPYLYLNHKKEFELILEKFLDSFSKI